MAEAKSKKRITFPLPETNDERALRTARAVRWRAPKSEIATGEMLPGEVYSVSEEFALYCVANKGARYVGADGKLTKEAPARIEINARPGQAGWKGWDAHRGLAEDFGQEAPATSDAEAKGAEEAPPADAKTSKKERGAQ